MILDSSPIGLYIHWPFCAAKCPYCDFNVHVRSDIDMELWCDAYLKSIERYAALLPDRVLVSIFFGGGTPSLMHPDIVEAIIDKAQQSWRQVNDIEITLEANPTSVENDKLLAFRTAGVNRVSLGVQAFNDHDLQFLGRKHSVREAQESIEIAAGIFDRFSFDLMTARPNQDLNSWRKELEMTQEFSPDHLSIYQLTIERSTPFYVQHKKGLFSIPNEDLAADFYYMTQEVLNAQNLPAYEVSNHARPGQESRHNLIYWQYKDYIGLGPGAHGRLTLDGQKQAWREHLAPDIWLERAAQDIGDGYGAAHMPEILSERDCFMEGLMMGLRLISGLNVIDLQHKTNVAFEDAVDMERFQRICNEGWCVREGDIVRLSAEGLLRLNAIVPYLLAA